MTARGRFLYRSTCKKSPKWRSLWTPTQGKAGYYDMQPSFRACKAWEMRWSLHALHQGWHERCLTWLFFKKRVSYSKTIMKAHRNLWHWQDALISWSCKTSPKWRSLRCDMLRWSWSVLLFLLVWHVAEHQGMQSLGDKMNSKLASGLIWTLTCWHCYSKVG